MVVSCKPSHLVALTLSALCISASTAMSDCSTTLNSFNDALERRALPEVIRFESIVAVDATCGDRLVEVQRRRAALQLLIAQQLKEKKSPLSDYESLVLEADKPDVLWSAAKMLGDIRFQQRRFGEAASAYERSIEIIKNVSKTPGNLEFSVIQTVYDFATRSRLLAANDETLGSAATFVPTSKDYRDGTVGGTLSENIRGFKPKTIPLPITFYTASIRFTPIGQAAAQELLAALREQNPLLVTIIGHTDERGGWDYNMRLSANRAMAVVKFLRDSGVTARGVTVAKGKTEPLFIPNPSGLKREDIWALNRRVEWQRN